MDELETKVAEALVRMRGKDPYPSVEHEARAAIAAMREHDGGGYEAAARECEREARKARTGLGEMNAWLQAARIIREHGQHARPVVDREGLARAIKGAMRDHAEEMASDGDIAVIADAIIAHFGAQRVSVVDREGLRTICGDAVDSALSIDCEIDDFYRVCAERTDALLAAILAHLGAQPAAVPASEPAPAASERDRELDRLADMPEDDVDAALRAQGVDVEALNKRTQAFLRGVLPNAPAASEPDGLPPRAPMQHELKTWPPFFGDVRSGMKRFDVRPADRDYRVCDTLRLREWDPARGDYSGEEHVATVTYVQTGGVFGVERGYVVLGLGAAPAASDPGLRTAFAQMTAPAASEPAATDAMVEAFRAAYLAKHSTGFEWSVRAGLRAALAAAPQRVREVGEAEAARVFEMWGAPIAAGDAESRTKMARALRAAGLRVAVPDGEWAALVAERDGLRAEVERIKAAQAEAASKFIAADMRNVELEQELDGVRQQVRDEEKVARNAERRAEGYGNAINALCRALEAKTLDEAHGAVRALYHDRFELRNDVEQLKDQLAAATAERDGLRAEVEALTSTRPVWNERVNGLTDQLAAATKRAEEAERELATWRRRYEELATVIERAAPPDAMAAAEARVRELEARPVVATVLSGASVPVAELAAIAEREIAAADGARCSYARQGERVVKALMERMYSAARPVVARDEGARKALEALARMYDAAGDGEAAQSIRAGLKGEG